VALDGLMNAPDFAPLSAVDEALGELKAMARSQGDVPELRNHAVGQAIENLDLAVKLRAGEAGPDVLGALEEGRRATRQKYVVAEILDELESKTGEPVPAYGRLVAPNDSRIALTRKIQQLAPKEVQKVARAYLDSLMDRAKADGGFSKAKGIAAEWEKLGPETKRALFRDSAYISDLNNFFQLAKRFERNFNPSGSAVMLAGLEQGRMFLADPVTTGMITVGQAGLSKLLHSRAGVKLLTQGFTMPIRAKVPAMALRAKLLNAGLEPERQDNGR